MSSPDPFFFTAAVWHVLRDSATGDLTIPLVVAAAAGAVLGLRHQSRMTLLLIGWTLVPLLILFTLTTQPYPRHLMPIMPPAIVMAAYGPV
jgi:hypothetical protein